MKLSVPRKLNYLKASVCRIRVSPVTSHLAVNSYLQLTTTAQNFEKFSRELDENTNNTVTVYCTSSEELTESLMSLKNY